MRKLMLKKGRSFNMINFSCTNGIPFIVDDETALELLNTGRFDDLGIVSTPKEPETCVASDGSQIPERPDNGGELTAEHIEKMKKDDLIALAEEKSIDIKDCSNNEERIERIKGALGLVNFGTLFEG